MAVDTIARAMAASAMSGGGGGGGSYGMPLIIAEGTEVSETITANHALICVDNPTKVIVTLGTPSDTLFSEYVLTFVAGTDCYLSVSAPQGLQLIYPDGTPVITTGMLYELNFAMDAIGNIIGLCKEIDLTIE